MQKLAVVWAWPVLVVTAAPFSLAAPSPDRILADARRLCLRIKSSQSRAAAFAELAVRLDASGSPDAERFWRLAQECAISPDDALARILAQRAVLARMLCVEARRDEASRYAKDLVAAAARLTIALDRALALREIGLTAAEALPELARAALRAAAESAGQIPEPLVRASALAETARALLAAEQRQPAADAAAKALDAWQSAEPSVERDLAAVELVRALAAIDPAKARATVDAIADVQVKARALAAMGQALARADLGQALMAVRAIADANLRALAMAGIARALAATQPDLAARTAREAVHASAKAPKAIRDLTLAAAAAGLAASDPKAATELVASIDDEQLRAEAAAAAAKAMAPKDAEAAVKLLQSVDAPEATEPAWPEVLYWYAKKNADASRELADNILERYLRVRALLRIYDAIVEQEGAGRGGADGKEQE